MATLSGAHPWDKATAGYDWFEHIHVAPKAKVEFGNIITQTENDYEIFNAYRDGPRTLSSIQNNATPGIELPDVSPPEAIPAMQSLLGPTSTFNYEGTSGLGTAVKTVIRAVAEGLATFDTNIVFSHTSNDVEILLSGSRIIFVPIEYEGELSETLAFLTDVIPAINGEEQRIALRKNPRQIFEVLYKLDGNDRQRIQALLMDWMDQLFGFPLWHEHLKLTADVSSSATSYPVVGADDLDFRVGGLAVVVTDSTTFDVITIVSKSDTEIVAEDPSVNSYTAGTKIMPLRIARLLRSVGGTRHPNNVEEFKVAFEVSDNDTGALTGDTTGWSTYLSRVLLDDCNVIEGTMSEEFERRVHRIDNQTGTVTLSSDWDKFKRVHRKGFAAHNRAEIMSLRRLLLHFRGRQKAFWIPSFIEDLAVKDDLTISTDTMDIERIEYVRFVKDREPKRTFRITFDDDTSLVRVVQSSVTVDATTERLTLDTTWPATRTPDEVVRVEFYEPARWDTDKFKINYPRIGRANIRALPVRTVFDLDP